MKIPFLKSDSQIVEEIHNEFDTAQERLLKQAKQIIASCKHDGITPEEVQADRLKKIGFANVPLVRKAESISKKRKEDAMIVVHSRNEADLVQYYSATYPFLKFLTEKELDRICGKYNLIHAPIANFIGEVPDKNISDIETAQPLKQEDSLDDLFEFYDNDYYPEQAKKFLASLGKKEPIFTQNEIEELMVKNYGSNVKDWTDLKNGKYSNTCWFVLTAKIIGYQCSLWRKVKNCSKKGLFIAAPKSDFNTKGLEKNKRGFFSVLRIEAKDPIVFRYVRGGIQVLTKWGLEANDPSLVLPINN